MKMSWHRDRMLYWPHGSSWSWSTSPRRSWTRSFRRRTRRRTCPIRLYMCSASLEKKSCRISGGQRSKSVSLWIPGGASGVRMGVSTFDSAEKIHSWTCVGDQAVHDMCHIEYTRPHCSSGCLQSGSAWLASLAAHDILCVWQAQALSSLNGP